MIGMYLHYQCQHNIYAYIVTGLVHMYTTDVSIIYILYIVTGLVLMHTTDLLPVDGSLKISSHFNYLYEIKNKFMKYAPCNPIPSPPTPHPPSNVPSSLDYHKYKT